MKRTILTLCLALAFAAPAFADPGGEGNNTGCNGVGNANSPCAGSTSVGGNGGAGGAGGAGGNAVSTATGGNASATGGAANATGGAVTGSGNSSNTNRVDSTNVNTSVNGNSNSNSAKSSSTQGQQQGQLQGQLQGQQQGLTDNSQHTATSRSESGASATQSQTANGGSATQGQKQKIDNSGNNTGNGTANVVVEGDQAQARNPVTTAYAPTVVTGTDQCLVAVSAGAQGVGFGLSFGSAIRDDICEGLKLARQLDAFGYREQAVKLLKALDPRVSKAFE